MVLKITKKNVTVAFILLFIFMISAMVFLYIRGWYYKTQYTPEVKYEGVFYKGGSFEINRFGEPVIQQGEDIIVCVSYRHENPMQTEYVDYDISFQLQKDTPINMEISGEQWIEKSYCRIVTMGYGFEGKIVSGELKILRYDGQRIDGVFNYKFYGKELSTGEMVYENITGPFSAEFKTMTLKKDDK